MYQPWANFQKKWALLGMGLGGAEVTLEVGVVEVVIEGF